MLTVTFASNLGLYRTFIDAGLEDVYVREGYEPFVDMLLANGKVKTNLFIEGVTARHIADKYPGLADKIRRGIGAGQFEMGTYTYNHPVLSTIPYRDTAKQMEEGLRIDRDVWGVTPKGTMLPEAGWDPSLPRILSDLGLSYMIMGAQEIKRDFPSLEDSFYHQPFTVQGIFQSSVTGLVMNAFEGPDRYFYIEGAIIQGPEQNIVDFDRCARVAAGGTDGTGRIMVCKNDGEFVYEGTLKARYGTTGERGGYFRYTGQSQGDEPRRRAEAMKKGWDILTARKDIRFATVSEFLAEHAPTRTIALRPSFKAHREWLEGSEKLAAILEESRSEIRHAEYAIKLASKLGRGTEAAAHTVASAWLLLLEAEISTGRRACAHEAGKASRVYRSMELAVQAAKLAEQSVDEIA